jgi:hypothetical protein
MTDIVDEFEARLSRFPLVFGTGGRVPMKAMPDLVGIYRSLSGDIGTPVHPEAFATRVVNDCSDTDPHAWPVDEVRRRALIAWASLARQHHLLLILRTRYQDDLQAAYWFPWLDHQGIDLLAVYEPYVIGVALSMDTDEARYWAAIKERRHHQLKGLKIMRFEVNAERNRPLRMANGLMLWLHPDVDAVSIASSMRAVRVQTVDRALLTVEQERALVGQLKDRHVLRSKFGYRADARPLLAEYRLAVRAKALGFLPPQLGLPMDDEAIG